MRDPDHFGITDRLQRVLTAPRNRVVGAAGSMPSETHIPHTLAAKPSVFRPSKMV
jgi:hypothetical protein